MLPIAHDVGGNRNSSVGIPEEIQMVSQSKVQVVHRNNDMVHLHHLTSVTIH